MHMEDIADSAREDAIKKATGLASLSFCVLEQRTTSLETTTIDAKEMDDTHSSFLETSAIVGTTSQDIAAMRSQKAKRE